MVCDAPNKNYKNKALMTSESNVVAGTEGLFTVSDENDTVAVAEKSLNTANLIRAIKY